jgi:hypothetical protein
VIEFWENQQMELLRFRLRKCPFTESKVRGQVEAGEQFVQRQC